MATGNSTEVGHRHRPDRSRWPRPNALNRLTTFGLYPLALAAAWFVFRLPDAAPAVVTVLATGSIFATFGSALMTLFGLAEKDALERVRLDLDILHRDLLRNPEPWRRWPFLSRRSFGALLDGTTVTINLRNPELPFDVGTHHVRVVMPSVYEDFFDLPVLANWWTLRRYRRAFLTAELRRQNEAKPVAVAMDPPGEGGDAPHPAGRMNEWMQYECMCDIWSRVLLFRVARYGTHFGAAVIFAGVLMTAYKLATFAPPVAQPAVAAGAQGPAE